MPIFGVTEMQVAGVTFPAEALSAVGQECSTSREGRSADGGREDDALALLASPDENDDSASENGCTGLSGHSSSFTELCPAGFGPESVRAEEGLEFSLCSASSCILSTANCSLGHEVPSWHGDRQGPGGAVTDSPPASGGCASSAGAVLAASCSPGSSCTGRCRALFSVTSILFSLGSSSQICVTLEDVSIFSLLTA